MVISFARNPFCFFLVLLTKHVWGFFSLYSIVERLFSFENLPRLCLFMLLKRIDYFIVNRSNYKNPTDAFIVQSWQNKHPICYILFFIVIKWTLIFHTKIYCSIFIVNKNLWNYVKHLWYWTDISRIKLTLMNCDASRYI
jgi:hypothetical protein